MDIEVDLDDYRDIAIVTWEETAPDMSPFQRVVLTVLATMLGVSLALTILSVLSQIKF
jgi:hypothetical protein